MVVSQRVKFVKAVAHCIDTEVTETEGQREAAALKLQPVNS